jgi:DNA-binding MarR family transcriptional regulator
MNKSQKIRELKEKYPHASSSEIADELNIKQGYVAHILWKAKLPVKEDFEKSFYEKLSENDQLRKEIDKLERDVSGLKMVIKYLREN